MKDRRAESKPGTVGHGSTAIDSLGAPLLAACERHDTDRCGNAMLRMKSEFELHGYVPSGRK
jgi:hypothetical protein